MSDEFIFTETVHPDIRDLYPTNYFKESMKQISCREFICKRPWHIQWNQTLQVALDRVLKFIHEQPALNDRSFSYFGATESFIMGSGSVQRYKKYWGNAFSPNDIDATEFDDCVDIFLHERENRLLYATCASVSERHLPVLFESLRLERPGFVSMPAQRLPVTEQLVREYFDESIDEKAKYCSVNQRRARELVCEDGGVHIQVSGGFDDRELFFYLHYRPDLLSLPMF